MREVDCHRAGIAFAQCQHKALRGKIAVFPFQNFRQIVTSRDSVHQHTALTLGISQLNNSDSQRRFDGRLSLLPFLQRDALISELPYRDARIVLVAVLAEQVGR